MIFDAPWPDGDVGTRSIKGPGSTSPDTMGAMTAARDELRRLVEELPDEQVPAALAEVRRLSVAPTAGTWPPAFFGSFSAAPDTSARIDEILAEGFGR
jgi:hypothetical protein